MGLGLRITNNDHVRHRTDTAFDYA